MAPHLTRRIPPLRKTKRVMLQIKPCLIIRLIPQPMLPRVEIKPTRQIAQSGIIKPPMQQMVRRRAIRLKTLLKIRH
jgi:hypothetical protein